MIGLRVAGGRKAWRIVLLTGYCMATIWLCLWLAFAATGDGGAVRQLVLNAGLRHPMLIQSDHMIDLFCVKIPVKAVSGYASVCAPMSNGQEWPLYHAGATENVSVSVQPVVRLPLGNPDMTYERLSMCKFRNQLLVACPRHLSEVLETNDAMVMGLRKNASAWSMEPVSAIPQAVAGTKRHPVNRRLSPEQARWYLWLPMPQMDCRRLWMAGGSRGEAVYICGEDHVAETIWCTSSLDTKKWGERVTVARDKAFPSLSALGRNAFMSYTDTGRFSYQNKWPDDLPANSGTSFWPRSGILKCRVSADLGRTWQAEETIPKTDNAISSACTWAADGTLWLVYVKSLEERMSTVLCLLSSSDRGKTWSKPKKITSGQWVDRDPSIIIHQGRPLVAFSRCRAPGKETTIWLWEGKVEAPQ